MRLRCEVHVSNRLLPSLNLRKPGRSTFTEVSIGRKPGDRSKDGRVFMMLCTSQNRNGTKYMLSKNVEQIFSKFIKEGKATIRLSNPTDDIAFSKADPSQLSMFLKLVRLASEGKQFPDSVLSTLVPASAKQIEKPPTSLHVSSPSQYPMSFPKSLQQLTVSGCSLRRISPQISTLTNLHTLDLCVNQLTTIPDSFDQLGLHNLNLSDNKLTTFPMVLFKGVIRHTLVSLDLRNNEIQRLPGDIIKLKAVKTLNLSKNELRGVPESLAHMFSLRNLSLSENKLEILPGSLLTRIFEVVDFSNNPFCEQLPVRGQESERFPVPTLAEVAARKIVSHSIAYTSEDLDIMSIHYLSTVHYCRCGKPCFEASVSRLQKQRIHCSISYNNGELPFLVYFCSKKCLSRFR